MPSFSALDIIATSIRFFKYPNVIKYVLNKKQDKMVNIFKTNKTIVFLFNTTFLFN